MNPFYKNEERVKIDIILDDQEYAIAECEDGDDPAEYPYSLSGMEYLDYLAVHRKYQEWQAKLHLLKPDDYVAPPPRLPLSAEEVQRRNEFYLTQREENLPAFLDKIAPLP